MKTQLSVHALLVGLVLALASTVHTTPTNRQRGQAPAQQQTQAAPAVNDSRTTKEELERWMTEFSNWGRWGKEETIGNISGVPRVNGRRLLDPGPLPARLRTLPDGPQAHSAPRHSADYRSGGGQDKGFSSSGRRANRDRAHLRRADATRIRPRRSMPDSGATTSTTGGRRTTAVCGGYIGSSGGSGTSG